jgi:hypothetical protein
MTDRPPPAYRLSLLPGTARLSKRMVMGDYEDDKPSISLTGFPGAMGDVYTPPSGTGVGNANLRDFDARRRFGKFGSRLVELQRVRQAAREALGRKWENEGTVELLIQWERERLSGMRMKRQLWAKP